jgi:hypothetical protein
VTFKSNFYKEGANLVNKRERNEIPFIADKPVNNSITLHFKELFIYCNFEKNRGMYLRMYLLLFYLISVCGISQAQDTIVLLTGKTILAKKIEVGGYSISYFGMKDGSKQKIMSSENVFSIVYANGNERIVYERDSSEETDFNVDQMRMFIRGEQDAMKYYKNNLNKLTAFAFGVGSTFFNFYGIIGPAVYSTAIGSFSPDMEKQKISDHAYLMADEYREGYQRKARDNKVKNSIFYGLAGFAVGFTTFSVLLKK